MPRKPRVYLPGIPTHVIQRGNDRAACFFAEDTTKTGVSVGFKSIRPL